MSVNISLSNKNSCGCKEVLEKLKILNIDARCIETLSLVDNNFEKGSLLTVGSKYILKNDFSNLWDLEYLEYLEDFEDFEDLVVDFELILILSLSLLFPTEFINLFSSSLIFK